MRDLLPADDVAATTVTVERSAPPRLRPPRPPERVVPRRRLLGAVDAGIAGPMTMVVGPAGAGKTVLLSTWAQEARCPVAWLALGPSDAAPRAFWRAVAQALAVAGVPGLELDPVEPSAVAPDGSLLARVLDALAAAPSPVVLVLDDFHLVAPAIGPEVSRLMEHPPEGLRLVLLSRKDPPLRLGRMRLAGVLHEIRARELACTLPEARLILAASGVTLEDPASQALWERTEGWVAAMRLASATLAESPDPDARAREITGEEQVIGDYLVDEVLSQQPFDVQRFLLHTAIVDELDGGLATALSGRSDSRAVLRGLAAGGVLVSAVDRSGRWFRYHQLFAEMLRAKLLFTDPGTTARLHAVAARWYADHGDESHAVHHAVLGAAWDQVAGLAAQRWLDLLLRGELEALAPLLTSGLDPADEHDPDLALALAATALVQGDMVRCRVWAATADGLADPASETRTRAGLALVAVLVAAAAGDVAGARDAAPRALEALPALDLADPAAARSLVLAHVGMVELRVEPGPEAVAHLRRALSAATEAESPWLTLLAQANLGAALIRTGDVAGAQRRLDGAIAIAEGHGWTTTPAAGTAYGAAALLAAGRCRFDEAEVLVALADRAVSRARDRPMHAAVAVPRAMLLGAGGDVGEGLDVVEAALEELVGCPVDPALVDALVAWQARFLAALGDRDRAREVLADHQAPGALAVLATAARLQVADGQLEAARTTLAGALDRPHATFPAAEADLWLVDALALDGLLHHGEAAEALERALDLLEPGALLRPVVAHGAPMLPLLHRAVRGGTRHRALVEQALLVLEGTAPAPESATGMEAALTERERQVLRYMPTHMTHAEIAAELYLSINTVKTHARAIYRKLGVDGRGEAVLRARRLRLLGPR